MARAFDGVDDKLAATANPPVTALPYSIFGRVYRGAVNTQLRWIGMGNSSGSNRVNGNNSGSDPALFALMTFVGANTYLSGGNVNGTWTFQGGTIASTSSLRGYLEAQEDAPADQTTTAPSGWTHTTIGAEIVTTYTGFWNGRLAEVLVFNASLSAAEAAALRAAHHWMLQRRLSNVKLYQSLMTRVNGGPYGYRGPSLTATGTTDVAHPPIKRHSPHLLQAA